MVQILAATPAYGGMITIDFHRSFVAMMNQCRQHGITLASMVTHSGFVSRARNAAAAKVTAPNSRSALRRRLSISLSTPDPAARRSAS